MLISELIENLTNDLNVYGDLPVHIEHEKNEEIYFHVHPDSFICLSSEGWS